MEQMRELIKAENMILVAALYCLGLGLRTLKRIPKNYIPFILTLVSIGLACLSAFSRHAEYANWAAGLYDGVVQGVLCAGMAVYCYEVVKHCPGCDSAAKGEEQNNPHKNE